MRKRAKLPTELLKKRQLIKEKGEIMTEEEYKNLHWEEKAILCGFSQEELNTIYMGNYNPYEWE